MSDVVRPANVFFAIRTTAALILGIAIGAGWTVGKMRKSWIENQPAVTAKAAVSRGELVFRIHCAVSRPRWAGRWF